MKTRLLPVLLLAATFPLSAFAQSTGSSGTGGSSTGTGGTSSSSDNSGGSGGTNPSGQNMNTSGTNSGTGTGGTSSSSQNTGGGGGTTPAAQSPNGTNTGTSGTATDQQNTTNPGMQPNGTDPKATMDSTATGTPNQTDSGSTNSGGTFAMAPDAGALHVSELQGKTVYGSDGAKIGKIDDVLISRNGGINAVVIGVGGFLGMGEKDVAVNMSALQLGTSSKDRIVLNVTRDELKNAPAYKSASSK